ncbi:MAG TPA: PAS domain-containing protein, partial [Gemmatimonadaceae bacterium]|nr:PAS domain-containing protein [Gemmatimonadaceae bacterium]
MWTIARRPSVVASIGLCIAALVLPQLAKWPEAHGPLVFSALLLGSILTFALRLQHTTTKQRAVMPPSFVIIFSALLLSGPNGATLVAAVGALAAVLGAPERGHPRMQAFADAVAVIVAAQFAGLAYQALGGDATDFTWPWSGLPISAAVIAYHLARGGIGEVVIPYLTKHPVNDAWPREAFRGFPVYLVGASVAVGLVEVVNHEVWEVLPVVGVALFFLYRSYCDYVARLEEDHYRREIVDAIQQGMSVVDMHGRVTHWNDTVERILGCPRDRAMGRGLVSAVPLLSRTELPRAVQETLLDRTSRSLAEVRLPHGTENRILQVNVLPIAGGAAILWQDVTERTHEERERRRTEERLALAAEAANDGLWEWDLRT